jgi:Raf kinase inhibitor-like YbhB/YbcL family protein
MSMSINSPAFNNHEPIPVKFTCAGSDISPALHWSNVPSTAKSLVLIVDDPDAPDPVAPKTTWVHWVLYNLPPYSEGLDEAVQPKALPEGTVQGINDWKLTGYGGPCPPVGRHRYFFKLYALDTSLTDIKNATKAQVEKAMHGHVIESVELMGTFEK